MPRVKPTLDDETYKRVRPYVIQVVQKHAHMFDGTPALDVQDVIQEACIRLVKRWKDYDDTRSKPQTFAYMLAWQAVQAVYNRSCNARDRERAKSLKKQMADDLEFDRLERPVMSSHDEDETIEDWARRVYQAARKAFPEPEDHPKARNRRYSLAQAVAVTLWRWKKGLTIRGACWWFKNAKSLVEAFGMEKPPNREWIRLALKRSLFLRISERRFKRLDQ